MRLRKLKTMCLARGILRFNSVKKQVITRLSSYVLKNLLFTDSECVEMMGLIGAGNNPMVGMTVACAVAVEEALRK